MEHRQAFEEPGLSSSRTQLILYLTPCSMDLEIVLQEVITHWGFLSTG